MPPVLYPRPRFDGRTSYVSESTLRRRQDCTMLYRFTQKPPDRSPPTAPAPGRETSSGSSGALQGLTLQTIRNKLAYSILKSHKLDRVTSPKGAARGQVDELKEELELEWAVHPRMIAGVRGAPSHLITYLIHYIHVVGTVVRLHLSTHPRHLLSPNPPPPTHTPSFPT